MPNYDVVLYSSKDKNRWDDFIENSLDATFLFKRDFMDYHAHRFKDFSLMILHDESLIAVLPANRKGRTVYSHQGLTYGGLIFKRACDVSVVKAVLTAVLDYLSLENIDWLDLKILPDFYAEKSMENLVNSLKSLNANRYRMDAVFAIDYKQPLTIHKTKLKHYKKNKDRGFIIKEEIDFTGFWNDVLIPRLREKHNTEPVHNLQEISLLKSRFDKEIRQFNVYLENTIVAGVTLFDKGSVIKSQYGATTKTGENSRALEYLFLYLIFKFKNEGKSFFSMGTVRDPKRPLGYNEGLVRQKTELGCKPYAQHFYKILLK